MVDALTDNAGSIPYPCSAPSSANAVDRDSKPAAARSGGLVVRTSDSVARPGRALSDSGFAGRSKLALDLFQHALNAQRQARCLRFLGLSEFNQRRPKFAYGSFEGHAVTAATLYTEQRNPPAVVIRSPGGEFGVQIDCATQLVVGAAGGVEVR